jgi:hypothetical protein
LVDIADQMRRTLAVVSIVVGHGDLGVEATQVFQLGVWDPQQAERDRGCEGIKPDHQADGEQHSLDEPRRLVF